MLPGYGVHFLLFISLIFYAETMNCETLILNNFFFNNFTIISYPEAFEVRLVILYMMILRRKLTLSKKKTNIDLIY